VPTAGATQFAVSRQRNMLEFPRFLSS